jgi:hypothetical protein
MEEQKVYNEQTAGTANYRSLLRGVAITYSAGKRGGKDDAATLQVEGQFSSRIQVRGKVTQNGSDNGDIQRHTYMVFSVLLSLRWNGL